MEDRRLIRHPPCHNSLSSFYSLSSILYPRSHIMSQNIGVFIDRDGMISEEVGYVNHLSRYQIYPWTAGAIRNLNDAGLKAIVVTNQAGVARGYFTEDLVKQVHEK